MICADCGNELRDIAKFCDCCGIKVEQNNNEICDEAFEDCSAEDAIKKIVNKHSKDIYNNPTKLKWLLSNYIISDKNMCRLLSIILDNKGGEKLLSSVYLNNKNFEQEFNNISVQISELTFIQKEIIERGLWVLCIGLNKNFKHVEKPVEPQAEKQAQSKIQANKPIEKEVNIDKKVDIHGNTALIIAADDGKIEEVVSLIGRGANVNARNKYGNTVLICAAEKGHIDIVKLLIAFGANINAEGNRGKTALMEAASYCRIEVVKLLITLGANVNARRDNGNTALMIAFSSGHKEIVQLLRSAGAIS